MSEQRKMYADLKDELLITRDQIAVRVKEMGAEITRDFEGKDLTVICILKGAVVFFVDLIREIDLPMTMDFMAISSYGSATKSSGVVRILKDLDKPINGKDVLIIEDIVDSGMTLSFLKENLLSRGAASLHIATLLDKPERRRVPLRLYSVRCSRLPRPISSPPIRTAPSSGAAYGARCWLPPACIRFGRLCGAPNHASFSAAWVGRCCFLSR